MWEERYSSSEGYLFGKEPALFLTDNPWLIQPSARVLCVADGEGRNGVHLAAQGMTVTSFDPSATAVGRAQTLAAQAGVSLDAHVCDWQAWDWSQDFDVVVGIFIQFADPTFRAQQFSDMAGCLRSGGRLILHGYRPEQVGRGTGGPPSAANMYTEEMLAEAFAGWNILRLSSYEKHQRSGAGHVGMAALIDFVAEKP